MSTESRKRTLTLTFISTLLILILLIGFSYAMYRADITNINKTETSVNTKKMGLIYTGQTDIDEEGILPGQTFEKTFTVENKTSSDEWYNIYMENITNDYGEDLVYTIYETDSTYENVIRTVVAERFLPSTTNGKKYLKTRIDIEAEPKVQYYKMVVEYKELPNVAQVYNKDNEFNGTVGIDQNTEAQEDIPDIDPDNDYTIIINPNGGTYNETTDQTTVVRRGGETYEVLVPQRVGHTFDGWEVSDSYSYKNNVVTVYSNDVTLTAKWRLTDDTIAVAEIVRTGTKYARIQDAENESIDNDTIKILKDTSEVFSNEKTVTIDFDEHTVTGKLTNTGNITLINGTLQNTNDYAINNTGTLILGLNDGTVERENIIVKSDIDHDTLSQSGTMKFYDGYVEGKLAIVGPVNETAEGYVVFTEHKEQNNKSWQKAYLVDEESLIAFVKRVDGTDMYYNDLQDAIDISMEVGKTVYAIADFDATATHVDEDSAYDIVFDINGHNVRIGDTVTNNKNLTITNTSNYGQLLPSKTITNNGNLLIQDVIISMQQDYNAIDNNSTLAIEGSTITARAGYAVNNTELGTISLDSDTYLHANTYALYNISTNDYTINYGNIYGVNNVGKLTLASNVNVYNNGTNFAINNASGSTLNFNGTIESNGGGIENRGTLTFNGNLTSAGPSAYKPSIYLRAGSVTINGGTIVNTSNQSMSPAIYAEGGTLEINDGSIISKNKETIYTYKPTTINGGTIESEKSSAIVNYSSANATLNITGGTIKGYDYGIIRVETNMSGGTVIGGTYGIHTSGRPNSVITGGTIKGGQSGIYADTTLTIGANDGILETDVSLMSPVIQGETYGLQIASGTTNYYDGILKGKTAGYTGVIAAIPDATLIKSDEETIEEELYQTNYIIAERNFLEIDFGNDDVREYNSFNKAIADIPENNVNPITIKVTAGGIVEEDKIFIKAPVTVPSTKKVIIDMDGHTLNFTQQLVNNGTLQIVDDSTTKNGMLSTTSVTLIKNNGTLTINDIELKNTSSNYAINNASGSTLNFNGTIESNGGGIENRGTLTFNGNLTSAGPNLYNPSIYLRAGSVTINGGTIINNSNQNTSSAIYAEGGTLEINDGSIISKNKEAILTTRPTTINGGTIESEKSSAIGNYSSATSVLNITGGTIKGYDYGIIRVETNMSGGTVIGGTYGIHTSGRPNSVITGGTIIGGQSGIYADATLTIGANDGTLENPKTPIIKGEFYGLQIASGTTNFYDGILEGKTAGYTGKFTNIIDNGYIATGSEQDPDDLEHDYITNYLQIESNVITNRTKANAKYNNIQDAIDAADNSDELVIETDDGIKKEISIYYPLTINKNITLDLNGYTLFTSKTITNSSNTTITNNDTNNVSKIYTIFANNLITNSSSKTLNIYNIQLQNSGAGNYQLTNNGIVYIDNVTITGQAGIRNNTADSEITITNNNINVSGTALYNSGKITITGGTYTGTSYGIYDESTKENSISNITTSKVFIYNASNNTITGSTINNDLYNRNSTILLTNNTIKSHIENNYGTMTANNNALNVYLSNNSTLNLKDNTFNGEFGKDIIANSGTLIYDNNNITNTTGSPNSGINNTGTLNYLSGSIVLNFVTNANTTSWNAIGIKNTGTGKINYTSGSLAVNTSTYTPYVYGIYNTSSNEINIDNINLNMDKAGTVYGIYTNTGTININNCNIEVSNVGNNGYSLYTAGGTTNIYGGTIISNNNKNSYGIYVNSGTVIAGEAEVGEYRGTENATVSITSPYIKGIGTIIGNGVKNVNGRFEMYDGILVGSTEAKPDALTDKEYHYDPEFGTDLDGYQTCYLKYNPVATD